MLLVQLNLYKDIVIKSNYLYSNQCWIKYTNNDYQRKYISIIIIFFFIFCACIFLRKNGGAN